MYKIKDFPLLLLSDLMFSFITFSGTTLTWFVKLFVCPRSADCASVVSKASVSELSVNIYLLRHSLVNHVGPCYYQCQSLFF